RMGQRQCLGLVPRTVRRLVQRLRRHDPNALVASCPSRPGPHTPRFRALIEVALQLRRAHPSRGAGLVRVPSKAQLGAALLGQKKYADAEPLLLAGYEGMKQREKTIQQTVGHD